MRAPSIVAGLFGVLVVVVLAMTSTSGQVEYADRSPSLPWEIPELDLDLDLPDPLVPAGDLEEVGERSESTLGDILAVIVLAITLFLFANAIGRRRWARREREEVIDPGFDLVDDRLDAVAAAVRDDAAEQRALLASGVPRNAIVECWSRLELLVEKSGVERRASDTSTELTSRTLGAFEIDPAAIGSLARLYREARFSTHPIGESHREAALDALDTVHRGLERRRSAEVTAR